MFFRAIIIMMMIIGTSFVAKSVYRYASVTTMLHTRPLKVVNSWKIFHKTRETEKKLKHIKEKE